MRNVSDRVLSRSVEPALSAELTLPVSARSAAAGRRCVETLLRAWDMEVLIDRAVLLTSELVGNVILIVPALVLFMHMDQRLAHGTSLAAVLPIAIASLIGYALEDKVDWPVGVLLAVGAVGGAVIGSHILHVLPQRVLGYVFAGFLLLTAVRLVVDTVLSATYSSPEFETLYAEYFGKLDDGSRNFFSWVTPAP